MVRRKHSSQEEIFAAYDWWSEASVLKQITGDRCDYIAACVDKVFGRGAVAQQDILEVGSGGGLICEEMVRHGATMIGLDPSQGALATARAHAERSGLGHNLYYQQGTAEAMPFANGSFSVIACLDVLEHVQDLDATIGDIARVLAPGGVFVFDTINRTLIARVALIWLGERFSAGLPHGLHDYHKFIKPAELHGILTQNGLQVREMTGFMPRGLVKGQLKMGPGWFKGVSYVGYATKGR
jgi:2-polyprenyl-6-hydroxyphenyl methylase / 3-demethylubiquinone-9 3-methyltransferase